MLCHQPRQHLEHFPGGGVVVGEKSFEVFVGELTECREIPLLELDHVRESSEMLTGPPCHVHG